MLNIKTKAPEEGLLSYIKECYFFQKNTLEKKYIPVIDDCCYDFIFFEESNSILEYSTDKKQIKIEFKIFTIHNLQPPYKIKLNEKFTFFTIKVQPWMNSFFFSNIKKDGVFSLNEYDRFNIIELHRRIRKESLIDKKFRVTESFFLELDLFLSKTSLLVKEICEFIYKKKGIVTVNELSKRYSMSRQYLNRVFKKEVLYSLKRFITTVRILDLIKYKIKTTTISLTEISYKYNYFDQSHFIRDFKQVCGVKPKYFFENLPEFMLRH
ncbi:MAG: helix-turn-helix transcriptional regulator [Flavobacteriaceae bacterium]|nr:helix-turn-helix transcriptional regulator [Flavobacteriaceae bacterium]